MWKAESWKAWKAMPWACWHAGHGKPGKPLESQKARRKAKNFRREDMYTPALFDRTQLKRTKAFWHSASVTSQTNTACKKYPEKKNVKS